MASGSSSSSVTTSSTIHSRPLCVLLVSLCNTLWLWPLACCTWELLRNPSALHASLYCIQGGLHHRIQDVGVHVHPHVATHHAPRACTRVSTPRRSRPETLGLDPDPYPPILHSIYWLTLNTPVHQCTQWSPLLHTSTPVVQRTQYCTPHHTACHAEWRKSRYPEVR